MKYGTVFWGIVAMLLLSECGGKASTDTGADQTAQQMMEDAARPGGEYFYVEGETSTSPDGTTTVATGAAAALPDDFPKDVPQYKGMQLLSVEDDRTAHTVFFVAVTRDSHTKVADFYKKQAEAKGWTPDTELESSPGSTHLTYHKGNRELRLGFVPGGETITNIMLKVTKE